jgi:ATPase subunit of ABC transporter with duplicated ATPase domains
MSTIRLNNIYKDYETRPVLREVYFKLSKGDRIGLIGKNGSGKTTALAYFPGAVIVASHDRFFIDKVATRLLIFEGAGKVQPFWGNWAMWQGL